MLLNRVEKAMMNNPIRTVIQRRVEVPRLLQMGGRQQGGLALEIGCGRGVGTELILDQFGISKVDAFDLDPHMVELARKRLNSRGNRVRLWTGDVTSIKAEDNHYDAVFDFGIIHHVPIWEDALREVYRVLKPGGRFYAEEVLEKFILSPLWRRLLDHPLNNRFDQEKFSQTLRKIGFQLIASRQLWKRFAWFVADKPI